MTCVCEHPPDTDQTSPLWDALVADRYGTQRGAPTSEVLATIKDTTLGDVSLEMPAWYSAGPESGPGAPPSDYDSDQEADQEQGDQDDSCTGG